MMMRWNLCLASFLLIAPLATADEAAKVTFEDHIKPIFRQHCVTCHHQGEKKGGLALDTYGSVIEGGGSGEIVYEGDADSSRLWQLVSHEDTPVMPPNQDKLEEAKLAQIRLWIEQGMPENSGSKVKEKKKNSLSFVASAGGKPEGPAAMPESLPQRVPVVTERAAAITAIATSPWAPLVAIAGQHQIAMYHTETAELLGVIPVPEGIPQSLRFSRDGSFLIVGGGEHAVQGVAAVYDVKTGERVATVGDELDTVFGADANDTMTRIALGGPKRMLRIYDAGDSSLLFDLKKHTDWIYTVAYSPDGVLIASGDRSGGLCVWEAETGRLYLDLTEHKGAVNAVAWRDDSNLFASASDDGTVKLWDVVSGKAIKTITAHGGGVMDVNFDHQGRIVTAGKDNRFKLWDPAGNPVREYEPMAEMVLECAISHDGSRVIAGDWTGAVVMVMTEDPAQKTPLAANPEPIETRIEQSKQTLASLQGEIAPLEAALAAADAAVVAAQKQVDELKAKIAGVQAESQQAVTAANAATATITTIDTEIPTLIATGRDAHDQVIASRIAGAAPAQLAEAEQKLGQQLIDLATKRRQRIELEKQVATYQQTAKAKTDEATQLTTMLAPLEQALAQATQARDAAKAAHEQVASRRTSVQAKIDRLAAEIQ